MIRSATFAVLLATAFTANATDLTRADPSKALPIVNDICQACHAVDGNTLAEDGTVLADMYPRIAGQFPEYIYKQLKEFKAEDDKPGVRANDIMAGQVAELDDEQMRSLAVYFSQQKMKPAIANDVSLLSLGEKIWRTGDFEKGVPACAGCHGPAGAGNPVQYPRISGQNQEYTITQLKNFRDGLRTNDPEQMMQAVANRLSDKEIQALAEYMAALR